LIGLNPDLIASNFLVILLAENRDDIESRASSQPRRNQLDRLGPGASGRIVQQQGMAAAGLGHKLALLLKWLS
jgi:hypothetical protein